MGVAQSVEVSEKIKNKTIDLLITLEAANVNGLMGDNQEDNLGSNVKQVINFNYNNSSYKGEGGTIEDKKNMLNINLKKGTTHTNMDNTILPGLISVLKALGDGKNALNQAKGFKFDNLKIYENGQRTNQENNNGTSDGGTCD